MEQPKTILFYEKCRLCLDRPGSATICEVPELPQDIYASTSVLVNIKFRLQKPYVNARKSVAHDY